MKIFFSYPHDNNAKLVEQIKKDLEDRGHEVWFDTSKIKEGDEWRDRITRGILDSQQVVAFLSKHSVRDPGVCLNEIAIALADKGEAMVTVLVEPEKEVSTPVSITHIQWLRMEDWESKQEDQGWYRTQFDKLVEAIEHPGNAGRNEELETLRLALDPMSFYAEIASHIPNFTGRRWIIERYKHWLAEDAKSRVLRIEGGPGLGKTAVSSYLAHSTKSSVLAVHLCQYNKGESRNPLRFVRTLAYQLATRLPDYRARLLKSVAIQRPDTMQGKDPASLWSDLISSPLAGSGDRGVIDRQRLAIIIDGLDEATVDGKNPIVELLAAEINQLPKWIGVVLTGRPDPELTQRLARFQPLVLRDDDPANLADLKDYCDRWLAGEVKSGKLSSTQAAAASQTLLKHSHGAFLYLSQARIAVAESMLNLSRPDTFPSGLTEIYQRFFERRFTDAWDDSGTYKRKIRPFLELVLASPEPLPLPLAAHILEWNEYDASDILRSLGSLIKRAKGGLSEEAEETAAPFHNSVREWLQDADAAGDFFVSAEAARLRLTTAVWQRYLARQEQDAYAWVVLPDLLPVLSPTQQDALFGALTQDTNLILFRLADSLAPVLRFNEAAASWRVQLRFSERLAAAAPENAEFARGLSISYDRLGDSEVRLGHGDTALGYYRQWLAIAERLAAATPENAEFARDLSISYERLGDIEVSLGHGDTALGYSRQALAIRERLAAAAPENAEFARNLSISYNRMGDIEVSLGHGDTALGYHKQALAIADRLATAAPENAEFARDLSISYVRLGDSEVRLGHGDTALGYYRQALAIAERLAAAAPENAEFARDLSACYDRLGDSEVSLGHGDTALAYYRQALAIAERLAAAAQENAHFARDLSISFNRLGDIEVSLGHGDTALAYYRQALAIAERLAAVAPENAEFARDLSACYDRLGDSEVRLGHGDTALAYYRQALAIRERLAAAAPENAEFARNLAVSSDRLGDIEVRLGHDDTALGYYRQALAIRERLAAAAPENAEFARNLSISYNRMGDIEVSLGHGDTALGYHKQALAIADRLAAAAPENAHFARDLSISYDRLGDIEVSLGHGDTALGYYGQALAIRARLAAAAPENAHFARDLAVSFIMLAQVTGGDDSRSWALKGYDTLAAMKSRGILVKGDETMLMQLKEFLGLS